MIKWNLSPGARMVQQNKSINITHHINKMKDKSYSHLERHRKNISQHPLITKTFNILERKGI